jgi:hypothetical protein
MDNTRIYIKQCEKAKEIQQYFEDKPIEQDDIIFSYNNKRGYRRQHLAQMINGEWFVQAEVEDSLIWLPRQDQLQEMVSDIANHIHPSLPSSFIHVFTLEVASNTSRVKKSYDKCKSMEQLWLVFVMWQKYRKIWDGEDWLTDDFKWDERG